MSRLRGAPCAPSALRDPSPRAVLAALDAFAAQMDDVEGASVFYGVLDAGDRAARLHRGRAPGAAGRARRRPHRRSCPVTPRPPLGSLPGVGAPSRRARPRAGRDPGPVLERRRGRRGGPDAALDRLAEVAREVLAAPGRAGGRRPRRGWPATIAEGVRRPQGWPDDVAVLVAHRRATTPGAAPAGARRRARGAARRPAAARHAGSTGLGMGEQDRVGVMVAVGEACANAAEHAYRGAEPGPMAVARRRRRRRGAHRHRPRRGHLAAAGPRSGRPRARAADHAPARRPRRRSRRSGGHDGHPQPAAAPHARRGADPGAPAPPAPRSPSTGRRRARWCARAARSTRPAPSSCGSGCWRPATAAPAGWSSTSPTSSCSAAPPSAWCWPSPASPATRAGGWSCTPPRAA